MGIINRHDEEGGIATLTLDDGKLNALNADVFREIAAAFDDCADASAVVLAGREGVFTAGLNTKELADITPAGMSELLDVFGRTVMQIWAHPRPVVAACTGHAIAAGTMLAMATDHAVAADGDFRWGLTETQIGFPLPDFAIQLSIHNLRRDRLEDLLLPGAVVDPATAVEVGFADELVEPGEVLTRATTKARELSSLPQEAYALTKSRLRGATVRGVLDRLPDDVETVAELAEQG